MRCTTCTGQVSKKFGVQKFGALVAFSTVWGSSDESLAGAGQHEFRAHFQNPMLGIPPIPVYDWCVWGGGLLLS